MNKTEATAMAHSIAEQELLPFLRSLEPQMISDEVFLSFCQTTILTVTKVMSDFCVSYHDFEHKEIWLEGVKGKILQGVDKFFNAESDQPDLKIMPKTFFQ
ncbi:hypothetical protein PsalMR5_04849 (plasmid) [Piscirickettsia salmonis]|uniref:hypothetical protein n=1 Tax=Piscirickettsia salmonis TaxID=1238 RepID=UPI0012BA9848|nr:hypothetical protein [Piscirickettsia salmonis]QGP56877.1 hypothetical protein PsalSR1_04366 [Piscirickettsia salmonis]QGP62169.1 hypothetical protein PsalBI1_04811 [Piscirickettsia salmonis]QGP66924.1 hypothetical protein PsalMR5_04849 [Piscirickettsia salmonis]